MYHIRKDCFLKPSEFLYKRILMLYKTKKNPRAIQVDDDKHTLLRSARRSEEEGGVKRSEEEEGVKRREE